MQQRVNKGMVASKLHSVIFSFAIQLWYALLLYYPHNPSTKEKGSSPRFPRP
jgi:hypothetical protein